MNKRGELLSVQEVISKHFECIILEADDNLPLKLSEKRLICF